MAGSVATIMDYPLTLNHLLGRMKEVYPTREIVSQRPDKSVLRQTYAEICERAERLARALVAAGVKKGDRVATLAWNHSAHLECYYGIPAAGGVMHTLNLRLGPADIGYIATHADDRIVIVDDVLLPLYEQFRDRMPAHRTVVIPFGGPVPDGMESYEDFIETGAADTALPEIDETDGCAMCYTSGTTGDPKGVIYSHRGMVLHSMVGAQPDMLNFSMNDCILPVVPMFHANAWGIPYAATMTGAKLVFPGPHLDPDSLIAQFIGEKVTFSGGVPTVWLGIIQTIEKDPAKYEALRGLRTVVGGSAAPPALIRRFQDFGITVLHAWGMTEMSPLGTVANVKPHLSTQGDDIYFDYRSKQGYAAPFVDLRHRDGDGNILPWDGESMGELEVRGPWIASSYFNYPEADDRWSDDGWFRTGDIVTMDGEGYVQITDRSKDVIKSGGEWISSVDLENAIMGHPAVKEAAVIALPHTKWDERPLACIVLKDGASLTKAELDGHLLSDFAKWQLPDDIVVIDEVPKTSTGKFQKLTLRNRFADWQWGADERMAG